MPELETIEGSDFYFVDAPEPEEGVRKVLAVIHNGSQQYSDSTPSVTCKFSVL